MADLLTHVLVPFVLLTVASWKIGWLDRRWTVVGMGGAAIPDLVKLDVVLDADAVASVVGVPFTYAPVSTLGGVLVAAGLVTLAFERRYWRRAYGLLVAGGLSALVLDGLRVFADGRASAWLYPFTDWRPPTPSLYVTSDPGVLVVTLVAAGVVLFVDDRRGVE